MAKKKRAPQLDAWCWYCELENTLPGRDSFEIEIYGMVGVPDSDLIAWQVRRSGERAASGPSKSQGPPMPKRPRIEKVALSADELRAQLAAHKALMSGAASTSAPPMLTHTQAPPQEPAQTQPPAEPSAPPAQPPQAPHKPTDNAPAPADVAVHPHTKALQQGLKSRLAYTDTILSPEEKMAAMPRYAYMEPSAVASAPM
ncbi:hypothetical protein MEQU1_002162 [Malassezia equina]|uniref:Uncharacterized protein n=1 Tax=Malassezia equina TaxID=1381935 RepID=A0AAF0EF75_9BASI|nr:hypothetical protein MEQU1_002162 [Malassezia equina]